MKRRMIRLLPFVMLVLLAVATPALAAAPTFGLQRVESAGGFSKP